MDDKAKIVALVRSLENIWNHHRLEDLGKILAEDADWVNVVGMWWRGREDIVKAHKALHAGMFRETAMEQSDPEIRMISNDVAIATLTVRMGDYVTPDGQRMSGVVDRLTLVTVKGDGEWQISSGHNTAIDPRAVPHDPIRRT
ncbi:MAG: SgcJ/EcaC family oxidoreductase [Candidatus Acidiferrales bacterium]